MSHIRLSMLRLLWIVCALALPVRAEGATPAQSSAWVLGYSLGGGNLSMEGDSLSRDFGLPSMLTLGHVLQGGMIVGIEARGWSQSEIDTTLIYNESSGVYDVVGTESLSRGVQVFTMTATVFPTGSGLYVRGGAGICRVREQYLFHFPPPGSGLPGAPDEGDPPLPSTPIIQYDVGFSALLAAGWEYRLRPRLAASAEAEYTRLVADHVGGNLFSYTAGLSFYW